jgi:anti-sigma B factor antagonist
MRQDPLVIEDLVGPGQQRILRLNGPLLISNLFDFQAKVRTNDSPELVLDFTNVPYVDSAGIGALVGAYITHHKDDRKLLLVGVCQRVRHVLQVAQVEQFFQFSETAPDSRESAAS